jgi:hypothetical protein
MWRDSLAIKPARVPLPAREYIDVDSLGQSWFVVSSYATWADVVRQYLMVRGQRSAHVMLGVLDEGWVSVRWVD